MPNKKLRLDFMREKIFNSFLMGGFECSTHRGFEHRRHDLVAATRHDEFARADYERLLSIGMKTARDGVRWHLIEPEPFRYDFSSVLSQVRAVRETGIQIIWDLFHYGYPDDLDIFSQDFPLRFGKFAGAFAEFLIDEVKTVPFFCPVNEISFYSWIAGEVGGFYPYERHRGDELKRQLVLASMAAIDAIRQIVPEARFVHTDPAIHIAPETLFPHDAVEAENHRQGQFHALDMLAGRREPQLGGQEKYLDTIGLNYYFNNQWHFPSGRKFLRGHPDYRPFSLILSEYFERYGRPILIAETGIEDEARPEWFRYVADETRIAASNGVPIEGICLYPIVNHPGWDDERHCRNGLWCYANEHGEREIYTPLAEEIETLTRQSRELRRAAHN